MLSTLKSVRPAEKWGGLVSLLVVVLSIAGIPAMTGFTENEIAAGITGIFLVAAFIRGVYQARKAGDEGPPFRDQLAEVIAELVELRAKVRDMDAATKRIAFPEADSTDPVLQRPVSTLDVRGPQS